MTEAPLIAINRHRMGTDGDGVTTLVAFHGCPLNCQYCLNPQCLRPDGIWRNLTPGDLYSEVEIDDLYFVATGGGICFGGGEPLLWSSFMREFTTIMNPEWKITLETALNVPLEKLIEVAPLVSRFFVDVKDMNGKIYSTYTKKNNKQTIQSLDWLASQGLAEKVIVRLPLIPEYNTPTDIIASRRMLEGMGFSHFNEFVYKKILRTE